MIQIGFHAGYNYPFVVHNAKSAAQLYSLLPQALQYAGGFDENLVQLRKLVPLDTTTSLGYITTLAYVTYPETLVDALAQDVRIPSSPLYNNPEQLIYNFTQQINPAIDIKLGWIPDDVPGADGGDPASPDPATPNGDPFNGGASGQGGQSGSSQGATAGIVGGAICVAAAYGAVMFIIARRYKRKKQAHRRTSSVSNASDMRQTPRSSPALMGGALLSRDFTGYGGVAGGRDSHGSGRSGMGNSSRTQYISAPVAAENSLGWN